MSATKFLPHVLVLPEDDANRQIANGFLLHNSLSLKLGHIQILPEVGGWTKVVAQFTSTHVTELGRYPNRFMVLLVDFDGKVSRLHKVKSAIPEHLADRVFVLGTLSEPENLKPSLGSYETIGRALADDCADDASTIWGHHLLLHNASELGRLRNSVRPILF